MHSKVSPINAIMVSMPVSDNHVSLGAMWAYLFTGTPISTDDLEHMYKCADCLNLLGICQISKSVPEVERRLKEHDPPVLTRRRAT